MYLFVEKSARKVSNMKGTMIADSVIFVEVPLFKVFQALLENERGLILKWKVDIELVQSLPWERSHIWTRWYHVVAKIIRQLGLQAWHRLHDARERILSLSHGNSQRGREDADGFCTTDVL